MITSDDHDNNELPSWADLATAAAVIVVIAGVAIYFTAC